MSKCFIVARRQEDLHRNQGSSRTRGERWSDKDSNIEYGKKWMTLRAISEDKSK